MIQPQTISPIATAAAPAEPLVIAEQHVLAPAGLDLAVLDRALALAMARKLDYADLYLQFTRYETWTVEDGIVKEGVHSIDHGVGVRAVTGERTGFGYAV